MSDFHSTKEWIALSRFHKAFCRYYKIWYCVDCGYSGEGLDSDHVLPAKHWKMARLWLCNLQLRCGKDTKKKCNQKKGVKLYCTPRTAKLLFYYGVIMLLRLLPWLIILWIGVIDYNRGPWDTTIAYYILEPVIEYCLMAFDSLLDAVAAWLSSRQE